MRQIIRKVFFKACLPLLVFFALTVVHAEEDPGKINIFNFPQYKLLLRAPEKILIEKGELEIPLVKEIPVREAIKDIVSIEASQAVSEQPEQSEQVAELKKLTLAHLTPKESYELEFVLSLYKLGRQLRGKLKYLAGSDEVGQILALEVPPSESNPPSNLGRYMFWIKGDSSFSVLSPISGKCREIPWEGIGDSILSSGLSLNQILFSFGSERLFRVSLGEKVRKLVPEVITLSESSLPSIPKYELKSMLRVQVESLSSLYKRSSSVIDIDSGSGLPYQEQFLLENAKSKRGAVLYTWSRVTPDFYIPQQIEYYEMVPGAELYSRLEVVSFKKIPTNSSEFMDEVNQLCPSVN